MSAWEVYFLDLVTWKLILCKSLWYSVSFGCYMHKMYFCPCRFQGSAFCSLWAKTKCYLITALFFNNINVVFILFVMEKFGDQNCTFEDPQGVVDANRITNRKDL